MMNLCEPKSNMRTTPLLLAMCLPGAGARLPTATAALGDVTLETALSFGIPMAVGAVVTALDSFAMVTQGNAGLVERLGKYDRTLRPGLHLKLPFVERLSCYTSVRERVLDVPAQRCITMDNAPLTADAVVFYRIRDLTQAKYRIDDYAVGLSNLILTQLRSEIGQLSLDQTFTAREKLNQILLREANAVTANWGIDVVRVEVRDILPSPEIVSAMELQMAAERRKRAVILESEGAKQSVVNAAEASRDAVVLAAEGERRRLEAEAEGMAYALRSVADALGGGSGDGAAAAARLLIDRAQIAANLALATSANAKVVVQGGGGGGRTTDAALYGTTLGLAHDGVEAVPPA